MGPQCPQGAKRTVGRSKLHQELVDAFRGQLPNDQAVGLHPAAQMTRGHTSRDRLHFSRHSEADDPADTLLELMPSATLRG